jgi:hypothetical protein
VNTDQSDGRETWRIVWFSPILQLISWPYLFYFSLQIMTLLEMTLVSSCFILFFTCIRFFKDADSGSDYTAQQSLHYFDNTK